MMDGIGCGLGESSELGGRRILALEGSGEWDIGGRRGRLRAKEGNTPIDEIIMYKGTLFVNSIWLRQAPRA